MVNFLTSMRTSVYCVYLFHTNIHTIITTIIIFLFPIVNERYENAHEIKMYTKIKLSVSGVLKIIMSIHRASQLH